MVETTESYSRPVPERRNRFLYFLFLAVFIASIINAGFALVDWMRGTNDLYSHQHLRLILSSLTGVFLSASMLILVARPGRRVPALSLVLQGFAWASIACLWYLSLGDS